MPAQEFYLGVGYSLTAGNIIDRVHEWSSVSLSGSLSGRDSMSFALRYPFGGVPNYVEGQDVRFINLLTSRIVFEGIVHGPVGKATIDPGYVDITINATDYSQLLEMSALQIPYSWDPGASGWPAASVLIAGIIGASFGHHRINFGITELVTAGYTLEWGMGRRLPAFTINAGTNTWQAIQGILAQSLLRDAGGSFSAPYASLKWFPGAGLVLWSYGTSPADVLGSSATTLTLAADGRPASIDTVNDWSTYGTAAVVTDSAGTTQVVDLQATRPRTGLGYLLVQDGVSYPEAFIPGGDLGQMIAIKAMIPNPSVTYTALGLPGTTPTDIRVGESLSYDSAITAGTVTGLVSSFSIGFRGGVEDANAATWPRFLDDGLAFDGTWNLDSTTSRVITRKMRTGTVTLDGTPRSFVASYRSTTHAS
jgi:hypothetical protein